MTTTRGLPVMAAAASAAALAGLLTFAHAARQTMPLLRQVVQKQLVLSELRRMENGARDDRALVQAYDRLRSEPAPDLPAVLDGSGIAGAVQWQQKEEKQLVDGWTLRRVELHGEAVPFASWSALLTRIEENRPRWRVGSISMQASGGSPGTGRAGAVLEIIEPSRS